MERHTWVFSLSITTNAASMTCHLSNCSLNSLQTKTKTRAYFSSFSLNSLNKNIRYSLCVVGVLNSIIAAFRNTFLLATRAPSRDVRLINDLMNSLAATCNWPIKHLA